MSPGFYIIKLSDIYGQLVIEKDYVCTGNNMDTEINLSEFSSGIYFLHIDSKNSSRVLKVVKE
ncbi:MAG: T9SS type A sorting domain-containing protein [Bacteroidetes bacterium]|nr:T9SS type A sorting domain-containing protein [Bacteroidota bacterium]